MVRQFGAAAIDNQTALSIFRSWIIRQPGLARSGYVGTIDDLAHKATTVMWYGKRTPLLAAIIREGARRGIRVSVQARKYSLQQVSAAAAAIWKQAAEGKWAGFKVTGVAGVSAANEGITVYGTYTGVPAARRAPQVRSLSTVVMAVPVHLSPGHPITPSAGRDADYSPFNSGDYVITHQASWHVCSTGFAIWLNGASYTTTAEHCGVYSNLVDRNDYSESSVPANQQLGNLLENSGQGAAAVMAAQGYFWTFVHGAHSTTYDTVIGYEDLGLNDLTCTEGGNSGQHCGVKVTNLSVWVDNGVGGEVQTMQGTQVDSGAIATAAGDSGGPVIALQNVGTDQVRAAGMIQDGSNDLVPADCPGEYDPEPCGPVVYFSSMRTIVCNIPGAYLYTYDGDLGCNG